MLRLYKHFSRKSHNQVLHSNEAWNSLTTELDSLKRKIQNLEEKARISASQCTANSSTPQPRDVESIKEEIGPVLASLAESSATLADYTISLGNKIEMMGKTQSQQADGLLAVTNILQEMDNKIDSLKEEQRRTSTKVVEILDAIRVSIYIGRMLGRRVLRLKLEDRVEKRDMMDQMIGLNERVERLEDAKGGVGR